MKRLLPPHDVGWVLVAASLSFVIEITGLTVAPVRIPLGLISALVLPGYALSAAAFPPEQLRVGERVLLTLGLSLALGCVLTVALAAVKVRLTPTAWAMALYVVTVAAVAVAFARSDARPKLWFQHVSSLRREAGTFALLGVAGVIATAATIGAAAAARHQRGPGFTELSLVADGGAGSARVLVTSHELNRTRFRLIISRSSAVQTREFTLAPGQTWQVSVSLRRAIGTRALRVLLYRHGDRHAYRTVYGAYAQPMNSRSSPQK